MAQRTVRLLRRHTHAGRVLEARSQLAIDERLAAWLIDQGIAEAVGGWKPQRAALLTAPDAMQTTNTKTTAAKQQVAAPVRSGCCGPKWGR